ncbi:MAG: alpha-ribazole phosphatase family protein [Campylobacterales bacterium]
MRLYLLRHASVDERYTGCYNGHIDISLSDMGNEEAAQAAVKLQDIEFDAVYCSDLARCRQTLQYMGAANTVFDERLREKSWGRAEGMGYDEICEKFGVAYESFAQFIDAIGGESIAEFEMRVGEFFDELKAKGHSNTLVVTHGGVIKTLLAKHRNLGLEEAFGLDIPYASITIIEDFV